MTSENTPAVQETKPVKLSTVIARMTPEINRALPKGMDADRIARLALTAIRKNNDLAACTPDSFAGALLTAAALGLEPGINGECYLVPRRNKNNRGAWETELQIGYQGMAKLFWQSPLAAHLDAQAVHERDEFDFAYGLNPYLTHKPARGDRGPVVEYYAAARLTTGATAFVVLSPDEIKSLRAGKVGSNGGIPDPQKWMERKTALRQLFKLLPKSTNLAIAEAADERSGTELYRERLSEVTADPNIVDVDGEIIDDESMTYARAEAGQ